MPARSGTADAGGRILQGGLVRPAIRIMGERGAVIHSHGADMLVFLAIAPDWSGPLLLVLIPVAALPGVIALALVVFLRSLPRDAALAAP